MAPFWAESRIFSGKAPDPDWVLDTATYKNRSPRAQYDGNAIHKDVHNDTDIELFLNRVAVETARMRHKIFLDIAEGSLEKAEQLRKYYDVDVQPRDVQIESHMEDDHTLLIDYEIVVKPKERKMEWGLEELAALAPSRTAEGMFLDL